MTARGDVHLLTKGRQVCTWYQSWLLFSEHRKTAGNGGFSAFIALEFGQVPHYIIVRMALSGRWGEMQRLNARMDRLRSAFENVCDMREWITVEI